jgi:hypothetical protein
MLTFEQAIEKYVAELKLPDGESNILRQLLQKKGDITLSILSNFSNLCTSDVETICRNLKTGMYVSVNNSGGRTCFRASPKSLKGVIALRTSSNGFIGGNRYPNKPNKKGVDKTSDAVLFAELKVAIAQYLLNSYYDDDKSPDAGSVTVIDMMGVFKNILFGEDYYRTIAAAGFQLKENGIDHEELHFDVGTTGTGEKLSFSLTLSSSL